MTDTTDVVKYQNELNTYPVFKLTEVEQDIFMALLSSSNGENQTIKINLYDMRKKLNLTNRITKMERFEEYATSLIDKICNPKIELKNQKQRIIIFVCFDKLEYDSETYDLTVHIQDDFYQMIKNYELGFTRFELAEFIALSGNYTKTLYRFLKQYRTQGYWIVKIEDFRRLFNIPEKYRMSHIDQYALKPAIKQLSSEIDLFETKRVPFKNLKVEKIKKKGRGIKGQGGVVIALKFTFDAEEIKKVPEKKKQIHSKKKNEQEYIPVAQKVEKEYIAEERH